MIFNKKISFIICLLLVLYTVHSYAGVHFGIISAVKSKVHELKKKKETQEHNIADIVDSVGGEIQLPDGASIVIPPGVLNSTTTVTLTKYDTPLNSIGNDQILSPTYRLQIPLENINNTTISSSSIILRIPIDQNNNSSKISKSQNASLDNIIETIRIKIGNYPFLYTFFTISNDIAEVAFPASLIISQKIEYEAVRLFPLENVDTKLFEVTNNPFNVEEKTDSIIDNKTVAGIPVIFIHGLVPDLDSGDTKKEQPHRDWDNLIKYLFKQNLNFKPFLFRYDTKNSIAFNSAELQKIIDYNFQKFPKIIIVAHSMGGLVAHNYIQTLNGYEKVSKLITLGTPFHGSPLAGAKIAPKFLLGNYDGTKDLKWDYYNEESSGYDGIRNQFLYNLYKKSQAYSSTKYVAFAGTFNNLPISTSIVYFSTGYYLSILAELYVNSSWFYNDGIVPLVSATYDGHTNGSDNLFDKTFWKYDYYDHSALQKGKDNDYSDDPIFEKIKQEILESLPPVNHAPVISSLTANPTSSSTVIISTITCTATDATITCIATDSDGDQLKYSFDWGDGTTSETEYIDSGVSASVSHSWSSAGTYIVNAKAIDSQGSESTSNSTTVHIEWTTTSLASTTNSYNSIAIDKNNKVHIAYIFSNDTSMYNPPGVLKYMTNKSGSWLSSEIYGGIENSIDVNRNLSILTDNNNKAHILFSDYTHAEDVSIKYTTNEAGSWTTEFINSSGGYNSSMAIDGNNKIHIVYTKNDTSFTYITNETGSWTTRTIGTGSGLIAIDKNNKIHIIYSDSISGEIKYVTNISDLWTTSIIDSTGDMEMGMIAIDSSNKIHITYSGLTSDGQQYTIKYATNKSGSWIINLIDSEQNLINTSIAIDRNNKVHIVYSADPYVHIKYVTNASGMWVSSTIDSTINYPLWPSVAIDSNNKINISYHDAKNSMIKCVTK